ncbi:MAG: lipoyl synthase [Candidatus Hydrothermia bacterium]
MERKPRWIRSEIYAGDQFTRVVKTLKGLKLNTVCVEAKCPNLGECWNQGTATFLILGDVCTRHCKFCATRTGNPGGIIDIDEAERVCKAAAEMGLDYVVITSVTRDDLEDHGADIYAQTVRLLKERIPKILVEVLVPDLRGSADNIKKIVDSGIDVFAHNVEVVRRLTPEIRDHRASFDISIKTISIVKELKPDILSKSGFMVGLGETWDEVIETMKEIKDVGVNFLTIGQYLQPSTKHTEVKKYYTPEEFNELELIGLSMGFDYVASAPLVRSSYRAGEFYVKATRRSGSS